MIIQAHSGVGIYLDNGKEKKADISDNPDNIKGYTQPTMQGGSRLDPGYYLSQMWIFVRAMPVLQGDLIGPGVRMTILLHELVHACGIGSEVPNHGNGEKVP